MDELGLLIQSRHPIVCVETADEERLLALLDHACAELSLPLFLWSVTGGLTRRGASQPVYETQEPARVLGHIAAAKIPAVYLLRDFQPYLADSKLVRRLREVAQDPSAERVTVVLSGAALELPAELRGEAARFPLNLPEHAELEQAVLDTFKELNKDGKLAYRLSREDLGRLAQNLSGLTLAEAKRAVSRCALEDRVLDANDLSSVLTAKRERIGESGVLEYVDTGEAQATLGGLTNLKGWLARSRAGFSERAHELGLPPPRGVMLVGVQGCGKSLAAKTIARTWGLPLLRLDAGRLFDKYVGESEKNLRQALQSAEAVAPVVLWIDEIEKAFAGTSGTGADADGGLSRRLFGSFLTWLQEKKPGVFVAATANDLDATPPELLRKGRFDEIFFVDLPNAEERREIFSIHLARRKQDPSAFDLPKLAEAADGFSGAEIEQVVVTALYGLLAENGDRLTTDRLLAEVRRTIPLSRSRAEAVAALRAMAADRFVPAR